MRHLEYIEKLAARRRFGMRPGLETITEILARLGNPHRGMRFVHIAGTNGKGATAAIADSILRAAGVPCARYTSPHLVRLNERFSIDGAPAPDAALERAAAAVSAAAEKAERETGAVPTFFECLTAAAFVLFREWAEKAGPRAVAVLETGLGGRLDATNVIERPLACAITRIGLDHCQWLGGTEAAIAAEKAGIVKPGRPVVCGAMPEEAFREIARVASGKRAPVTSAPEAAPAEVVESFPEGQILNVSFSGGRIEGVRFPLAGSFQRENVSTAVALAGVLAGEGVPVDAAAVRRGLENVSWPGRFQCLARNPYVIVDGAHNPPGIAALVRAVRECRLPEPVAAVAGFCADKDVPRALSALSGIAQAAFCVRTGNPRSMQAEETASLARAAGFGAARAAASLEEALDSARAFAGPGGTVLVCGSLFLAGDALRAFGAAGYSPLEKPDPSERLAAGRL